MAGYDGYVVIGTKVDTSGIEKGLSGLEKTVSTKADSMSKSITNIFSLMKKALIGTGLVLAIRAITKELGNAVTRLDTMKNYVNVMSNLGIDAEEAEESIQRLSDALDGLPTTLDQAALSVQRFASANGNIKASTEMVLALNNAILAGGAAAPTQAAALEQLSQAYAKGKPDMMEWRTALQAMPAQLRQVAEVMGYASSAELGEAMRKGTVSMNEFMTTLVKMNKEGMNGFKSLDEQARNATGGIATSIQNLKTALVRGLANIMDAIGRENIVAFINNVKKAIDTLIPYIAAFIKACVWAISAIRGLFGIKTNNSVNQTKKSVDNLGVSSQKSAKNIDKTTGSVNKLAKAAKTLAGFDEMNVLSEQSASDSSAGGGAAVGGIGDIDLSAFDDMKSKTTSKLDEIYAIIQNYMMRLGKKIDFKSLGESFKNFTTQLSNLGKTLGNIVAWIYKNVIEPFAIWTISKALPVFLDILAAALELVNNAINHVKPLFNWLWNSFLKPIAEFTGEAIIVVLKGIADALKWIAENEIARSILEGVAIAIGLIAASMAIYNAVTAIAAVVTTGFGAAMTLLTSPITLIVLAIGTLIAVILLIINHWEQLKQVAINVWNAIATAIGNAVNWIKDKVTAIFQAIINWVKENWSSILLFLINPLAGVFKYLYDNCEGFRNFINDLVTKIANFFTNLWTGIKNGAKNAIDGVKNFFKSIPDFFSNIINKIMSLFKSIGTKVGNAVGSAFKSVINGVLRAIENILNFPIKSINKLIDVINKVPGVNVGTLPEFNLPRLAKGAIASYPGRGIPTAGGGALWAEAGQEAYLPLTDSQFLNRLGQAIGEFVTINANITNTMNGRVISRELQKVQNDSNFAFNK